MLTLHNSKNNLILSVNKKAVLVVSIKLNKLLCKKTQIEFCISIQAWAVVETALCSWYE